MFFSGKSGLGKHSWGLCGFYDFSKDLKDFNVALLSSLQGPVTKLGHHLVAIHID